VNPVLMCYIIPVLLFITIVFFSLVSSEILADAISGRKQVATDDNSVFFSLATFCTWVRLWLSVIHVCRLPPALRSTS